LALIVGGWFLHSLFDDGRNAQELAEASDVVGPAAVGK
jgi:hypothetical protein